MNLQRGGRHKSNTLRAPGRADPLVADAALDHRYWLASCTKQAAVETPGEEDRPLAIIDVRKAPAVKRHDRVVA